MDQLHNRNFFWNNEIVKFIITALMSILKMIKLQNLVQSVMTYKKYNLAKFATFVYFRVKHVKIDTTIERQESPFHV